MYFKGANLLHIIRQIINDDEKFRKILRGLNETFYHKTVNSKDVENYISKESGIDFSKIFDQYLRTIQIPVLEYRLNPQAVSFRWTNCNKGFDMKVKVQMIEGRVQWIQPSQNWVSLTLSDAYDGKTFIVDRNFYIKTKKVK